MTGQGKSSLAPFRYPDFRLLWTATLVSNLGVLIQGVGAAWGMTEMTSSPQMVSLVQASVTFPIMLLAMLAGAISDNFDRRTVMLLAQIFMLLVSVALTLITWTGNLGPWGLLACTFLLGAGTAFHLPAWQSSMRDLVPRDDLPAAVTLNSMSFNLMRSVGPVVGGAIVVLAGLTMVFALNAVSYFAVIYALIRWKPPREEQELPAERLGSAVWAGVRYISFSTGLMRIMLRTFMFSVSAVSVIALLPIIARNQLQGDATTYGLLLGLFGAGAILGALGGSQLRARFPMEMIITISFVGFATACILLALATDFLLAVPGLVLAGASWVTAFSHFNVSTQLGAPRWVVGRALSIYQTLVFGGQAIGAFVWGAVSGFWSLPVALLVSAGALLGGALFGRIIPVPGLTDNNLDPANRFNIPALNLDLKPRSGPIVISIAWTIPKANTEAFLDLMAERRRIRRRDGAAQWILQRDLENPDTWVETYRVATWTEYIRHNRRRTAHDAQNHDQLALLHQGPEPPLVRRRIERPVGRHSRDLPDIVPPSEFR